MSTPRTIDRRRSGNLVTRTLCALTFLVGLLAGPAPAVAGHLPVPSDCQSDVDGANDQPGQKDLTQFCAAAGTSSIELNTKWNWDLETLPGGNTGDACSLYDSDADGNANLVVCITIRDGGTPADLGAVRLFTCGDGSPNRCTSPVQLAVNECVGGIDDGNVCSSESDCTVPGVCVPDPTLAGTECETQQTTDDPFPAGEDYPIDTEALCAVDLDDFGAATAVLLDACSYPSESVNSDPSDCIRFSACSVDGDCDDGNPCTIDTCNTTLSACVFTPDAGASCNDGDACTDPDTCNSLGFCDGGPPPDCDDGSVCTDDSCDPGTGCVNAPNTVECRPAAGDCDVAEFCDGVSSTCPADEFASSATECRTSAGACDLAENCTGVDADCPADQKSTAECRAAADDCDVAETCDGVSDDCPADGFASSATVCRAAAGDCDVAESCTGFGPDCPADGFVAGGTECRTAAGQCDLAEACTGADADCPAYLTSTALCRSAAGDCDVAETCDGASADCPADGFVAGGTECRAAAGQCDLAEACTGADADCPADLKSTALCRAAAGDCDVAETCDGASAACPADGFVPDTTECRAAAGDCDIAETCTGASADCPADGFEPDTTECRAVAGDCDVAETCTGTSADCPADGLEPDTTECRAAAGDCDVAETCTGTSADCPPDGFDTGTICRIAADECDVAEACDGTGTACPPDQPAPDGTDCNDGDLCTTGDACVGGLCVSTPVDCTDTSVCTADEHCDPLTGQCVFTDICLNNFMCHEVRRFPTELIENVVLEDVLFPDPYVATVKKLQRLCNPASVDGDDPDAPNEPGHLAGYQIKRQAGFPKFEKRRSFLIVNELHPAGILVDIAKPDLLLLPTAKDTNGPPAPLVDTLSHYECHQVKKARFRANNLTVEDQFFPSLLGPLTNSPLTVHIKKPYRLCIPATKETAFHGPTPIVDPPTALLCYKTKTDPARVFIEGIFIDNQFVAELGPPPGGITATKTRELCVPSSINAFCGNDFVELPSEECDGIDDAVCPGQCLPPGGANECTCG